MWTRNWWNAASFPLLKGAFNSGFVVRSAVVTGMGCLPLPGNRRLLPADWPEGFQTPTCWESSEFCFQHLENPFIPVNKPPRVQGRCFLFPPNTEKKRRKWGKKKVKRHSSTHLPAVIYSPLQQDQLLFRRTNLFIYFFIACSSWACEWND